MASVREDAVYIRQLVKSLNKVIDRTWELEAQKSGLTRPQVNVFHELYDSPGISLKDLSRKLGMAHSTVSGIIVRLEKKGYVEKRSDSVDKRFSRLYLSEKVDTYVTHDLPASLDAPLIAALSRMKDEERDRIRVGLELLQKSLLMDR